LLQSGDAVESASTTQVPGDGATGTEGEVDIDTSQPLKREFYGPGRPRSRFASPAPARMRPRGVDQDSEWRERRRELQLVKALTTIGRPGHQVAVITRRPTGYFIAHVEGEVFPP